MKRKYIASLISGSGLYLVGFVLAQGAWEDARQDWYVALPLVALLAIGAWLLFVGIHQGGDPK